uniref:Uncharacterized protein n=1 Tax=Ditylenchus dipsaci TaxID=166011 RepID=A0A915EMM1_9BILA
MRILFAIVAFFSILQIVSSQDPSQQAIDDALPQQKLEAAKALADITSSSPESEPAPGLAQGLQLAKNSPQAPSPPGSLPNGPPPPGGPFGPPPPGGPFGPPPNDNGVPPGFESVLPADIIQQLKNLHDNQTLSFPQKREEFDRILNSVPGETLAKLPFPPGFEALPTEIKNKIKEIHTNAQLSWNDKSKQIGQLIESLPPNQRQQLPGAPPAGFPGRRRSNFPPAPPPGFDKVLPKDVYEKLLVIHQDLVLSPKEKIQKIDAIIRSLDQNILDALPLPPADQRQLVKPPMPPVLNQLPKEVKDQIDAIFDNENLDEEQRHTEFWKLVDTLPPKQKASIHAELGDGQQPGGSVGAPFGDDENAGAPSLAVPNSAQSPPSN